MIHHLNEETFYSYNHFLDGEDSYQDVNDTSSILITSCIFNSSQVKNQRQFDLFDNFEFNQPIYDDFYNNKLEQIGCDFVDLIQENVPKEIIVQEEALDSYNTDVDSLSNNPFHCINPSNSLCHSFDFHCTYHDWVVDWLEKYFLARFHHLVKICFPYLYTNMVRFHSLYLYINFILISLIHYFSIFICKHSYHAF